MDNQTDDETMHDSESDGFEKLVFGEMLSQMHEKLETAQSFSETLSKYYKNINDQDNHIKFAITRDILRDLAENLKPAKIDSK